MGSGMQFEYKVWRVGETEGRTCHTMAEITQLTGIRERDIRYAIQQNKTFNGWRITRYSLKEQREAISQYAAKAQKEGRKRNKEPYDSSGIIGFDENGQSHLYKDMDEAKNESHIPKTRIWQCLREGCEHKGWCFDYAIQQRGGTS